MTLSFYLAIFTPVAEINSGVQDLLLLLTVMTGGGYLYKKESHKLQRRVKWQLTKEAFKSFFKKRENKGISISPRAFWITIAGIFLLLGLIINFLVGAIVVVGGLIIYAIIANRGPSY